MKHLGSALAAVAPHVGRGVLEQHPEHVGGQRDATRPDQRRYGAARGDAH